ncbi:MAG TPA: NAD-dependent epimerase/dehydratase family protein [Puia sp.]|nr:NAD-dependent epimerase/dehydratase family protein [Puia sp.]
MGKRIFITGGFGFIGSAVIKHLQHCGHEIFVYDDLSFGSRQFIDIPDSRFVRGNILDADLLGSAMRKFRPEWVIHLAAVHFIPFCNEHPFESANINIAGTMNVLKGCRQIKGLEKVLFASTAAVYPIHEEAIPESLPPAPSDIYGLSKMTGEELCKKFQAETGIPTILCRFFNAFGPNETNPHLIPAIQRQVLEGKRTILLGNTRPKRDFIHTYDMARAVELLLNKFEDGIDTFNLGRGIEYSVLEVIAAFEKALGETLTIETDPARMRKSDRLHLLADIAKLSAFAGWQPEISLEEGIKTLVQS